MKNEIQKNQQQKRSIGILKICELEDKNFEIVQ